MALATAHVEILADTRRFERDLQSKLRKSGTAAGKAFATAFQRAAKKVKITPPNVSKTAEKAGRTAGKAWSRGFNSSVRGRKALTGITKVFSRGGNTRAFSRMVRVGTALSVVIAGLGSVAVQAAAELSTLVGGLGMLPALGAGAAITLGTLVGAFHGMGEAISAGLSGDMKKFQEALRGLTPAGAAAAKAIAAMRAPLMELRDVAQQNFFAPIVKQLDVVRQALSSGAIQSGVRNLSSALGEVGAAITRWFGSYQFTSMFKAVANGMAALTRNMGLGVLELFDGLAAAAKAAAPLLADLGRWIGTVAAGFGTWLENAAKSGQLVTWIRNAATTFQQLGAIVTNVGAGIVAMFGHVNAAGGKGGFLTTLQQWSVAFRNFANSTKGALLGETIVSWAQVTMKVLGAAIMAFVATMVAIRQVITAVINFGAAIGAAIGGAIGAFGRFNVAVGQAVNRVTGLFIRFNIIAVGALLRVAGQIAAFVGQAVNGFIRFHTQVWQSMNKAVQWIASLPGRIVGVFTRLGTMLWQAGKNIIQSLISGIQSRVGAVGRVMGDIAGKIRAFLPFSPAKEGPLSGSGNPERSGRKIGAMVASGITAQRGLVGNAMHDLTTPGHAALDTLTRGHPPAASGPRMSLFPDESRRPGPPPPQTTTITNHNRFHISSPANGAFVARRAADRLARITTA